MLAFWTLTAQASVSVSLAWDPSPDTNVVGYALYFGNSSGNYPLRVDAGSRTSTTVTGLTAALIYYFVAVAYTADAVESLPSNEVPYRWPADGQVPAITVTAPTSGRRCSNDVFIVKGTARDDVQVSTVWYQLNGGSWTNPLSTDRWTNWTATVNLAPGTNVVRAYAVDTLGNKSPTNAVSFVYVTYSPLTLIINGFGTVSPGNYNAKLLEVGRSYTLTAKPGAGCLFSNWTGSMARLPSGGATLRFLMQSNAVLTASFVTNPFTPLKGNYYGLINGAAHESSGFFSGTLGSTGTFSAKLLLGGRTNSFTGQFDLGGHVTKNVLRSGDSPLLLDLQLDRDGLSGTVSNLAWVSELAAYRSVFNATNNPCPYAGNYTMALPGREVEASPAGTGYGLVRVDKRGLAVMNGTLAEGSLMGRAVPVSPEGDWPLYVPLYGGKGSLMAWLKFLQPAGLTNAVANWIKPANPASKYYPLGFTNVFAIDGSAYLYLKTNRVLSITSGVVVFSGGNLAVPVTNRVMLTATNRVVDLDSNRLTFSLNLTNGCFRGTFRVPDTTRTNTFKGVLLQEQNSGTGFFLGTNQCGSVSFGP